MQAHIQAHNLPKVPKVPSTAQNADLAERVRSNLKMLFLSHVIDSSDDKLPFVVRLLSGDLTIRVTKNMNLTDTKLNNKTS